MIIKDPLHWRNWWLLMGFKGWIDFERHFSACCPKLFELKITAKIINCSKSTQKIFLNAKPQVSFRMSFVKCIAQLMVRLHCLRPLTLQLRKQSSRDSQSIDGVNAVYQIYIDFIADLCSWWLGCFNNINEKQRSIVFMFIILLRMRRKTATPSAQNAFEWSRNRFFF